MASVVNKFFFLRDIQTTIKECPHIIMCDVFRGNLKTSHVNCENAIKCEIVVLSLLIYFV